MSRTTERFQLAVAIIALVVAMIVGLLLANDAHAAVSHRVNTQRATTLTGHAQWREWLRHDRRAHSWRIRCAFRAVRHAGARSESGVPTDCTFRVYRTADHRRLLAILPFDVRVIRRVRDTGYEDGSGTRHYDARRSLAFDPKPRPH